MTSVFGGAQTIPQTQQTSQAINQATTQQQQQQTAQAQVQQQTITPAQQASQLGGMAQSYQQNIFGAMTPVGQLQFAPLTGQQTGAINQLVDTGMGMQPLVGQGQQYLGQGAGFMGQAGQAITPQDINSFYNPMAGNVTAQLQNIFGQQNLASRLGATAESGGIGGDRAAVAQGILANQQTLGAGQIYSQLYQNALQAAQQQKAQQLAAGQGLAGTAFPTMQAGMGGLGTALQAATIPQQQLQQAYNIDYQNQMARYQDVFTRLAALQGGIPAMNQAFGVTTTGTGLQGGQTLGQALGTLSGSQLGTGLGQVTYPAPAVLPQIAGLGSLGLGAAGLFGLSDRTEKTDIKKLGVHPNGLPLYAYRYKGDPKTYPKVVGPMAQDVAKIHPGLVARLPKRQSGGSVLALPTVANWQAKIPPMLSQGMAFQPLFSASMPPMGGSGTGVSVNVGGGGGTTVGGLGGGNPYSWAPGQPVSQGLAAQLAAQPAGFWAGVDPQNMGLGRSNFGGPGGSYGLKRGGRVYQDGGAVDVTDTDNDTEPDDDTDDTSTNKVDFTKYAKGMNLLNQYAKSATPKTPQVQPIKMPDTPWRLGQMPAAAAMSMQRGGDADDDSGSKTVPSADPDLAALRFEQTANLVQGHEVPPFQKGFAKGGPVKGYADAGEVEPAGLPVQADELPDEGDSDETGTEAGAFNEATLPSPYRQRLPGPTRGMGGLGGFAQSPYFALMNAGLGMLAASGQRDARGLPMSPLGAVGAGGMQGLKTLQEQQAFDLAQRKMMLPYEQLTAAQQLEAQKPVPIGPNIWGQMQYAVRTPGGQLVDPRTKQPINSSEMGEMTDAKLKSMAKGIANYDLPPISPYRMTTPAGAAIMEEVRNVNDKYDAKNYTMANQAKKAFGTGPQGEVLRRFNTYVAHSYTLENALQALEQAKLSGDYRAFNAIAQTWADQTGSPLPRTFNAIRDIYGNEAVAATVGMRNALGDREEIHKQMAAIDSPQALRGIINAHRELAGGNIRSLKREYETATMGARDFEDKLLPESREALSKIRSYNRPEGQPAEPPENKSAKAVDTRDESALKADPKNAAIRKAIDKKYGEGTAARLVGE